MIDRYTDTDTDPTHFLAFRLVGIPIPTHIAFRPDPIPKNRFYFTYRPDPIPKTKIIFPYRPDPIPKTKIIFPYRPDPISKVIIRLQSVRKSVTFFLFATCQPQPVCLRGYVTWFYLLFISSYHWPLLP